MGADGLRSVEPTALRREQLRRRRIGGVDQGRGQQRLFIDDLQRAVAAGPVAEVHTALERNRAVQLRGNRTGRAGLLADQAEVADEPGVRGITEVEDLRHATRPPSGRPRDQVGNARLAVPPTLVAVAQTADDRRDQRRRLGDGDVVDFMVGGRRAKQIHLVLVGAREVDTVAGAYHLGPARLAGPLRSLDVKQVSGPPRVGDVHDRRPVVVRCTDAGSGRSTVMADVGDPAVALMMHDRLVRRPGLEVVEADELHVVAFCAVSGMVSLPRPLVATHLLVVIVVSRNPAGIPGDGNEG